MKNFTRVLSLLFLCVAAISVRPVFADVRGNWRKDLFPVDRNGKWGFINDKGQIVIEPVFEQVSYFSEGVAAVKVNGKYGFVD